MSMNNCANICLCHDVCVKKVQPQFFVKCTCEESVSQIELLFCSYLLYCLFNMTIWSYCLYIFFCFLVLGRLPFFPRQGWSCFFLILPSFFSIRFLFLPFSWFTKCSHYLWIVIVLSSIISVIVERSIKLLPVVSVTLSSFIWRIWSFIYFLCHSLEIDQTRNRPVVPVTLSSNISLTWPVIIWSL